MTISLITNNQKTETMSGKNSYSKDAKFFVTFALHDPFTHKLQSIHNVVLDIKEIVPEYYENENIKLSDGQMAVDIISLLRKKYDTHEYCTNVSLINFYQI